MQISSSFVSCVNHNKNASIGAYQGYHGTAWFQKTESRMKGQINLQR